MSATIVLVHGAFAESASWERVIHGLMGRDHRVIAPTHHGHRVIAAANPLRGLAADAASIADLVRKIDGPVVLVGHSYGGAVISNVPADAGDIVGLTYVAGFAPESGESCLGLTARYPGSTLADALQAVPRADATTDLYITQERFHGQFCADVPGSEASLMAETQRPVTQEALAEPSGDRPLWREVPSWFVFGEEDRNIPAALQHFMAERAGALRAVAVPGASHAIAVSRPDLIAQLILQATDLRTAV